MRATFPAHKRWLPPWSRASCPIAAALELGHAQDPWAVRHPPCGLLGGAPCASVMTVLALATPLAVHAVHGHNAQDAVEFPRRGAQKVPMDKAPSGEYLLGAQATYKLHVWACPHVLSPDLLLVSAVCRQYPKWTVRNAERRLYDEHRLLDANLLCLIYAPPLLHRNSTTLRARHGRRSPAQILPRLRDWAPS